MIGESVSRAMMTTEWHLARCFRTDSVLGGVDGWGKGAWITLTGLDKLRDIIRLVRTHAVL